MKICDSDAFLDMPLSTQCLYFHLNMRADDDGFIGNSKRILKLTGASEDDLKLLIVKRFIIPFDDGVMVIKHWRMHNTLSKSRYHETQYLDEKNMLRIKDNGAYSLDEGNAIDDSKLVEMFHGRAGGEQTENADLVLGKGLVSDSVLVCSNEEILYQLGTETLTHTQHNELLNRFSKDILDEVINRIVSHPYHGCLNPETIAKWCEESKNRPKAKPKKNGFINYDQRDYSSEKMAQLEKMLINKG
jgi:hypothetical protein